MPTSPPHIRTLGYHNPQGARHWVITEGLKRHGYAMEECRSSVPGFLPKMQDLRKQFSAFSADPDALLVAFPGQYVMPLARLLAGRRMPVIFDAFISLHDTMVTDRGLVHPRSPKAMLLSTTDRVSCALADLVLLDTEEHCAFFAERFGIPKEKMLAIPIGCRNDLFLPRTAEPHNDVFTLVFHGTFIPLQGIDTMLHAMHRLQEDGMSVRLRLIGGGQTETAMRAMARDLRLRNTEFIGSTSPAEIVKELHHSDAAFGIFGTGVKADRVIPHKAYEIIACRVPLVTGATNAAKRVFTDGKNALLSTPGDANALANAVVSLMENPPLRSRLAENGYRLFTESFTPECAITPLVARLAHYA